MDRGFFNQVFKQAMDEMGIQPSELAEAAGRTRTNISSIRGAKSFPTLSDFVMLLNCCESLRSGFTECYIRLLLGETRRQTLKPEELISSLDSTELGALLIAVGCCMFKGKSRENF